MTTLETKLTASFLSPGASDAGAVLATSFPPRGSLICANLTPFGGQMQVAIAPIGYKPLVHSVEPLLGGLSPGVRLRTQRDGDTLSVTSSWRSTFVATTAKPTVNSSLSAKELQEVAKRNLWMHF